MLMRYSPWFAGEDLLRTFFDRTRSVSSPWSAGGAAAGAPLTAASALGPRVDVVEKDNGIEIVCDVPGARPDDIDITLENGVLTISAKRSIEHSGRVLHSERYAGELTRAFQLGDAYDANQVSASLNNGVLHVYAAKRPEAAPRKIPIEIDAGGSAKQLSEKAS